MTMLLHEHPTAVRAPVRTDERAARSTLRSQIARLERELGAVDRVLPPPAGGGAPRLLGLAELERVRDELVERLAGARAAAAQQEAARARARAHLEAMLRDPAGHRWQRVTRKQLGQSGCGDYHVRPRLGLLGMLAGWWEVKLSSGCPLAMADYRRPRGPRDRAPLLELVVSAVVFFVLLATLIIFLFVYHDVPLRVP
jgi:hypothetical protein